MKVREMIWNLTGTQNFPRNIWLLDNKSWLRCVHRITDDIMEIIKDEKVITTEMFDGRMFITIERSLDDLRTGHTT